MSKKSTSITLPLDSDGFLRRECPSCKRELKWLYSTAAGTHPEPPPGDGYFCPYCGDQAPADQWLTKAQVRLVEETAVAEFVQPLLRGFKRDVERGNRPGGPVSITLSVPSAKQPTPLTESDDMRRVDFSCHPTEPIKVLEDWEGAVRCIICGATSPGQNN